MKRQHGVAMILALAITVILCLVSYHYRQAHHCVPVAALSQVLPATSPQVIDRTNPVPTTAAAWRCDNGKVLYQQEEK